MRLPIIAACGALVFAQSPDRRAEAIRAMDRAMAEESRRDTTPAAEVQPFLATVAAKLQAAAGPETSLPAVSAVLTGKFAEPVASGSEVLVPAALLGTARTESEFAAVVAHGMAHAVLSHRVEHTHDGGPTLRYPLPEAMGTRNWYPAAFRKVAEALEIEADAFAIRICAGAGYDPQSLLDYLVRQNASAARIRAAEAELAATARSATTVVDTSAYAALRARAPFALTEAPTLSKRKK